MGVGMPGHGAREKIMSNGWVRDEKRNSDRLEAQHEICGRIIELDSHEGTDPKNRSWT